MTEEQIKKTLDEIFKKHNVCISDFKISYENMSVDIYNTNLNELLQIYMPWQLFCVFLDDVLCRSTDEFKDAIFKPLNKYLKSFRHLPFFKSTNTCILDKLELLGKK